MEKQDALDKFKEIYGDIDFDLGFNLKAVPVKTGFLMIKTYQRNSWVDCEIEKKVLFHKNGQVYENNKKTTIQWKP